MGSGLWGHPGNLNHSSARSVFASVPSLKQTHALAEARGNVRPHVAGGGPCHRHNRSDRNFLYPPSPLKVLRLGWRTLTDMVVQVRTATRQQIVKHTEENSRFPGWFSHFSDVMVVFFLLVCLSVSKITQKVKYRFKCSFQKILILGSGSAH